VSEPEPPAEPPEDQDRRYPSTIGGAFYVLILIATAGGIGIVFESGDWRLGVRVVSGALFAAALLRLVLRQRDAGMLAVRGRLVDVALLVVVAAVLFYLAGSIPDQPL
jgi:hypothetical protein